MIRNSSLLLTLGLVVTLPGDSVPEVMAAEPPGPLATYQATVKIEHASQEVLVRSVQNRLAVTGVDLAEVKWVEVRGPKSAVRTHSLATETAERFLASVGLPGDFEGPARIAIGFSDNSERVLSVSFPVVDPVVEAVFTPIDEKGDRVPPRIPITDELVSRVSVLAIQCPGPSVPFLNWVDATSVAPPLPICHGWPTEFQSNQGFIYYFRDQFTGQTIGQNCPVKVKLVAMDQSGFHCHSDTNRPVGTYNPKLGNTGPSGEEFAVAHQWPRCATFLQVMFWSTQAGCPSYNDSTTVDFYYAIVGSVVLGPDIVELVEGTGYTLKPPTAQHPDAYWGLVEMNQELQAVAAEYADSVSGSTLGFNDMSLGYGGTFDLGLNWNPQHCGHQVGNELDFRCKLLNSAQQRIARHFFLQHNFVPMAELVGTDREHWHVKYYGPGTYRGPGHTLNRP